jgi:uncharacterized protein YkuJ
VRLAKKIAREKLKWNNFERGGKRMLTVAQTKKSELQMECVLKSKRPSVKHFEKELLTIYLFQDIAAPCL